MKLAEIFKDIGILSGAPLPNIEIGGVSCDSRETKPGDLFVAVKGFVSDGHDYIAQAIEKGAVAVSGQYENLTLPNNVPYIQTADSRETLALTARAFYGNPAASMTLIGVTGTNGKTTTTTLIKHMIEDVEGAKVGLIGTNLNMIGDRELETEHTTPESLELQKLLREMADAGCEYVVMEVSSHSLVLQRVAGIRFAVGVFTNLTQDHLDFHSDMQDYAEAKAILFKNCENGAINADDEYAEFMVGAAECPLLMYSLESADVNLTARNIKLTAGAVSFDAEYSGAAVATTLSIPGRFSIYNALSVISTGLLIGYSLEDCAKALSTATGVNGRVEAVPTDGDYSIIIDYAHTPDALENVLCTMSEISDGRLIALFGCGGDRDKTKRPKMGAIAARLADFVIVTSDNPRTERPEDIIADIVAGIGTDAAPYVVVQDRREAIAYAIDNHQPGDIIVLAGKGHETYQIIGTTKHHMDEREIVSEYLQNRQPATN